MTSPLGTGYPTLDYTRKKELCGPRGHQEGGAGPGSCERGIVGVDAPSPEPGFAGRATLGKNHSGLCLRAEGDGRMGLFSQGQRLSNWWSWRAAEPAIREQGLEHLGWTGEGLGGDLVQGGSETWAHPSWPRQAREGATGQRSHLGRAVRATDRGAGPCAPRLRSGPFPVRLCLC